jgi:hypothetical protein
MQTRHHAPLRGEVRVTFRRFREDRTATAAAATAAAIVPDPAPMVVTSEFQLRSTAP